MKVLLTGFTGFLGRHLCNVFLDNGFKVRVLLHRHTIRKTVLRKGMELIWGSIGDEEVLRRALDGVDAVVHSAWSFSPPLTGRPTENERATELLFSKCVEMGIRRFAFLSSVAVYGMKGKTQTTIKESFPFATGSELTFIYPSEKISIEKSLLDFDKGKTQLAIFRPGPIFDDRKGPAKRIVKVAGWAIGIGFGTGRNHMPYIHAVDVAEAVYKWLRDGQGQPVFNIVPTTSLNSKEWIRAWAMKNGIDLKPLFIPGVAILLLGFGVRVLKKILRKEDRTDIKYIINAANRDLQYSNESLKESLGWMDKRTAGYADPIITT